MLLFDVVVSALYGKHHGVSFGIDPLFQPPQPQDRRVMGSGDAIGNDALRPEVGNLRDAPTAVFPGQLDARRAGHGGHGGGHNSIGPEVFVTHTR